MGFAEANSHTVSKHWFDWAQLGSSEEVWFCFVFQTLSDVVGLRIPNPPVWHFGLVQLILMIMI